LVLKLDDYTGFALGGNKVRKLETELAPHRLRGIDTLITCGGAQSNHARVTAAAAAHLGLRCILVINGQPEKSPTGNARLHQLLTPHIRWIPSREDRGAALEQAQADVEAEGSTPLVVPIGASTGRGALGYALAMKEIEIQSSSLTGWEPARTWLLRWQESFWVRRSSGGRVCASSVSAPTIPRMPSGSVCCSRPGREHA
jgi:D-cysteine desulfhydrase